MAEESFENKEIAKLLNKYFICIKVDKEEMPHIDSKYQVLHKKLNNHPAGWPINIFMSNKKEVFFMSGYIPPYKINEYEGLKTLVPSLYHKYKNHKLDIKIQEIKKLSYDTNEILNIKIIFAAYAKKRVGIYFLAKKMLWFIWHHNMLKTIILRTKLLL